MKQQLMRKTFTSLVLLAAMFYTGASNAHFYNNGFLFNQTTQVLTLTCPAGTAQASVAVLDGTANAGIMSVTVFQGGSAQVASDSSQGNGVYGSFATVSGGAGPYYLIVSQTASLISLYKLTYHCEDANGTELAALPTLVVTQP